MTARSRNGMLLSNSINPSSVLLTKTNVPVRHCFNFFGLERMVQKEQRRSIRHAIFALGR
jgi:hypothetical protein